MTFSTVLDEIEAMSNIRGELLKGTRLRELTQQRPRLLVVGDLILDEYLWGEVSRISPEAPVPVLLGRTREFKAGGAGSVVENLAVLGAEVLACGIVGNDDGGDQLRDIFGGRGVATDGLVISEARPTTRKTRLMAFVQQAHRALQQIQRVDWESSLPLSEEEERNILAALELQLAKKPTAILVSDYEKGLLTEKVLRTIIDRGRAEGIPVLIDPGRSVDYARYRGATLLCPNRFEAEHAAKTSLREAAHYGEVGERLRAELELDALILTLDREGIYLIPAEAPAEPFPTRVRQVTDVAGAGDMVLSLLGLGLGGGWSLRDSVRLANLGAGIEVSTVGVTPVEIWELELALQEEGQDSISKVRTVDDLLRIIERQRSTGQSVVFTNGCFDFLHCGHLLLLEAAAAHGDILVVGLNSDSSVRRLKGEDRPIFPGEERARLLSPYPWIDHIVFFDEETPLGLIERLKPDVLVKGEDYRSKQVVGREVVERYGGRVELVALKPNRSTSSILERIRGSDSSSEH